VRVWDLRSPGVVHKLYGHRGAVRAVDMSADGGFAASGGKDGAVTVWDLSGLRRLRDFSGHSGGVTALALSRDGRTVVTGGQSGQARRATAAVRVWDVVNSACRLTYRRHTKAISAVRFTPDEGYVLSASHDGTMQLWPLPD
jgi:WD40 repeat protein